jgi:hypothetical protein
MGELRTLWTECYSFELWFGKLGSVFKVAKAVRDLVPPSSFWCNIPNIVDRILLEKTTLKLDRDLLKDGCACVGLCLLFIEKTVVVVVEVLGYELSKDNVAWMPSRLTTGSTEDILLERDDCCSNWYLFVVVSACLGSHGRPRSVGGKYDGQSLVSLFAFLCSMYYEERSFSQTEG